jgi:hypothetical protein
MQGWCVGNVVPLFDPDAPLRGKARDKALEHYREAVAAIAHKAVYDALAESSEVPGAGDLGIDDVLPALYDAFRAVVDRHCP